MAKSNIITLPPRAARRTPPPRRDNYDWLRVEAMRFMRTELTEDTPATETAEILATLRRIEQRLTGENFAACSIINPGISHHNHDPLTQRRLP